MVVSQLNYKNSYVGDGSSSIFFITFPFQGEAGRVQVFLNDVLQSSGYAVEWNGTSWLVHFSSPKPSGMLIDIIRSTPITQDMIYVPNDEFPAKSHESALDKLTMINQELAGRQSSDDSGSGINDGTYGDVTVSSSGAIWTINSGSITIGELGSIGLGVVGRGTGSGAPQLVGFPALTNLLDPFTSIARGVVPPSGGGTTNFLRADGNWSTPIATTVWGGITGILSNQTDLQSILNSKSTVGHTHVSSEITDASSAGIALLTAADFAAQTSLLSVFTSSLKGIVPGSGGGTANFLRADGTWASPPGGGGSLTDGNKGDITVSGSGATWVVNNDAITNAKLANMGVNTIKGAISAGDPIDLTGTQVTSLLDLFSGAVKGIVPASGGGTSNFLRADGAWAAPGGGGSVAWGAITGTLSAQTDLQTALNGKANTSHTHAIADVTNLQTTLDGKQPLDSDLTAIAAIAPTNDDIIQRKSGAWINRTMAQVKTDLSLTKSDVGLANVDNTSDVNKPVSTATQTALNLKADITSLANAKIANINFIIDGGGAVITTGQKGYVVLDFACTINQVTMVADQTGSIVVDIWKDTYTNFPPVVGDSITASAKPTITTAQKSQDATQTGWNKTINAGDILAFNVDSVSTIQRVTVSLKVTKS